MSFKKNIAEFAAASSVKIAKKAGRSASIFGFHQPKEPDMSKVSAKK
ncbi:MAG: cyclic lactone autoinducer peptide [Oscillospiraceae bacterium]|nr:cyclic lactone autoinducer peptide [Oscillospiraceae bacterium]